MALLGSKYFRECQSRRIFWKRKTKMKNIWIYSLIIILCKTLKFSNKLVLRWQLTIVTKNLWLTSRFHIIPSHYKKVEVLFLNPKKHFFVWTQENQTILDEYVLILSRQLNFTLSCSRPIFIFKTNFDFILKIVPEPLECKVELSEISK